MKIKRDAFLYLDGDDKRFAQCGTCVFGKSKCALAGGQSVNPTIGSCGFYVRGPAIPRTRPFAKMTPEQMGYVERQARCENCKHIEIEDRECDLFEQLNRALPELFDLDEKVHLHGCCNAQVPK